MELFGSISVETPKYKILRTATDYEIRKYPKEILAKAKSSGMASSQGFQTIAEYIFGKTQDQEKQKPIAMTAPVINTDKEMYFVMPSKFKSISELPKPNEEVELVEQDEQVMAVKKFSGIAYDNVIKQYQNELESKLIRDSIAFDPQPVLFRYNPPWTLPFLRTNEIAFKLIDFKE